MHSFLLCICIRFRYVLLLSIAVSGVGSFIYCEYRVISYRLQYIRNVKLPTLFVKESG
jgi:hypothetical protein